MSKTPADYHNKGQQDASRNVNKPPHSVGNEFAAFCGVHHKSLAEVHKDNQAYRAGQQNVKKK